MDIKTKIIENACILFCQEGDNMSLAQIAHASGMKKQSLYNYFTSKEDLIQEMLTAKVTEYYSRVMSYFKDNAHRPAKDQLYGYGLYIYDLHHDPINLYLRRWINLSSTFKKMEDFHNMVNQYQDSYSDTIRDIILEENQVINKSEEHVQFMINLYNTTIIGMITRIDNQIQKETKDDFYDRFFDYFWTTMTQG